ncbi:MAG: rRNA maturation RNase YbeY [Pseudomonadales bacterium]|nr:rRNA maturation RNase YbeY [Pseudomonadales bacterium]
MKLTVALEKTCTDPDLPSTEQFTTWAVSAQQACSQGSAAKLLLGIRIVDEAESAKMNEQYRQKQGATNVLSFPSNIPASFSQLLEELPVGDLLICAPVVRTEAQAQGKALEAHWAHMVIHGVLHLNGHDHDNDADAEIMESLETRILNSLHYPAPYTQQ